jgi:predicted RNA-binding protein with PUA-like domain
VKYWLLKTEPSQFSFDALWKSKTRTTGWDEVRNYQARNLMRDEMQIGDLAFFYHSSADPTGIAGIVEIVSGAETDPTQFDKKNEMGYDPKSKREDPRWVQVQVRAVRPFPRLMELSEIRKLKGLSKMVLLQRGSRLSVQPVAPQEWEIICKAAGVSSEP